MASQPAVLSQLHEETAISSRTALSVLAHPPGGGGEKAPLPVEEVSGLARGCPRGGNLPGHPPPGRTARNPWGTPLRNQERNPRPPEEGCCTATCGAGGPGSRWSRRPLLRFGTSEGGAACGFGEWLYRYLIGEDMTGPNSAAFYPGPVQMRYLPMPVDEHPEPWYGPDRGM
ncbi:hypothetical protein GCM10018966_066990 [Streptomyces yanii]